MFFWAKLLFSIFMSIIALTMNELDLNNIQLMASQLFAFLCLFAVIIYLIINFKKHENIAY